jgi:two-component response regulator (ARR-A family)
VKPLQSKDVQRLRNCSTTAAARPSSKGAAAPCEADAVAKRNSNKPPLVLPPSSAAAATSPSSGRRANLAGVAMVRTTSARRPPRHSRSLGWLPHFSDVYWVFVFLSAARQVLHSSSVELSQYLPLLLKLVVLAYAVLCLGELLNRWSSSGGRCSLSPWCA